MSSFLSFDPSLYTRVTFWNTALGGTIAMLGTFATNQATVQRYLSLPSLGDAKKYKKFIDMIESNRKINVFQSRLVHVANVYNYPSPYHTRRHGCDQ